MNSNRLLIIAVVGFVAISCAWAVSDAQHEKSLEYPSGYRSWQHIKTMIIRPGHALADPFGGIHHVYANSLAVGGLSNARYTDGSVFVFDLLDYDSSNDTIVETGRKRIDVMQYDSERFSETGGWGFDTFVGDSKVERVEQDAATACFNCHLSAKESNYIFSQYRP